MLTTPDTTVSISSKKLLSKVGLSVSFVPSAPCTLSAVRRDTKGWLVEFVGPSGIGKTTLWRQVSSTLRHDWFFERHAKGLLGNVTEHGAAARYLRQLFVQRLLRLHQQEMPLERTAEISQRVCEVVRLGIVTKSPEPPRGFVMDDGILHFFAEQVLAQDRNLTREFLNRTAFVFLLPEGPGAKVSNAPQDKRVQLGVYYQLRDLLHELGRPMLVLNSEYRDENPMRVITFTKDILSR